MNNPCQRINKSKLHSGDNDLPQKIKQIRLEGTLLWFQTSGFLATFSPERHWTESRARSPSHKLLLGQDKIKTSRLLRLIIHLLHPTIYHILHILEFTRGSLHYVHYTSSAFTSSIR